MKTLNEKSIKLLNVAKVAMGGDHVDVKMFVGPDRMNTLMLLKGIIVVNEMLTNKVDELIQQGDVANIMEAEDKYVEISNAIGALCNADNVLDALERDIIVKYNKESRNTYHTAEENYELALLANETIKHFLGIDFIKRYEDKNIAFDRICNHLQSRCLRKGDCHRPCRENPAGDGHHGIRFRPHGQHSPERRENNIPERPVLHFSRIRRGKISCRHQP